MTITQKEDGLYYVKFRTISGTDEEVCTNKDTLESAQKVVADAKIAEIEAAADANILSAQVFGRLLARKAPTAKEAYEEYCKWMREQSTFSPATIRKSESYVGAWITDIGLEKKQVALIEPIDVSKYVNSLSARKLTTRRAIRSHLASFLNYCMNRGFSFSNPAQCVRVDHRILTHEQKEKRPVVLFTEAEVATILRNTTGFWHVAVALAFYTGLRLSDIVRLEWACFQHPGKITVWTLKTNSRITFPLPLPAQQALEHAKKVDPKFVFPVENMLYRDDTTRLSINFPAMTKKLGLGHRRFHNLRHSYVTRMRAAGMPVQEVSNRVGHRSTLTTEIYTHLDET